MKIFIKLLATISLIFIIGCSGIRIVNSPSIPTVKADEALIFFYRPSSFFAGALTFRIAHNNQIIGALNSGTYFYSYMKPGNKDFSILIYSPASPKFHLPIEAGKVYYIRIKPKPGFFKKWTILYSDAKIAFVDEKIGTDEVAKCKYGVLEK